MATLLHSVQLVNFTMHDRSIVSEEFNERNVLSFRQDSCLNDNTRVTEIIVLSSKDTPGSDLKKNMDS